MLFKDFIASVEEAKPLERIHEIMKKHFCFNYNIQCMNNEDEYFRFLNREDNNTYVGEPEPGMYTVFHCGKKVMTVNFNNGIVWAIS